MCNGFRLRAPIYFRISGLWKSRPGVRLNEHLEHPDGLTVFQHACKMGLEGIVSKRLGSRYRFAFQRRRADMQELIGHNDP